VLPNRTYYPDICLEGLKKMTKDRCAGRHSDNVPSEHKSIDCYGYTNLLYNLGGGGGGGSSATGTRAELFKSTVAYAILLVASNMGTTYGRLSLITVRA
jgi:hypothetical protein